MSVVFPAPFGPRSPVHPSSISQLKSLSAVNARYRTVRFRMEATITSFVGYTWDNRKVSRTVPNAQQVFNSRSLVPSTIMAVETTLVLIKPGGVERDLIGEIVRRFEQRSLKIVGLRLFKADRGTVEEHYAEHRERPFFGSVVEYLTSGPIVAIAVRGESAVKAIRTMMGATNPLDAAPGTIRGDFALTIEDNLTHSSSDSEAAERELLLWFPDGLV